MDERTFPKGTPTRCNRCNAMSPFPKAEARAVRENSKAWRLQTFATLDCGHMDAHWIFNCDLEAENEPSPYFTDEPAFTNGPF